MIDRAFFRLAGPVAILVLAGCSPGQTGQLSSSDAKARAAASAEALAAASDAEAAANDAIRAVREAESPGSITTSTSTPSWSISESHDRMTDRVQQEACLNSVDKVNLPDPYGARALQLCFWTTGAAAPSHAQLHIVGSGQYAACLEDCAIRLRLDGGKPQLWSAAEPSDSSTGVYILSRPGDLFRRVSSAKRVMLEASFFEAGRQAVEFHVPGAGVPHDAQGVWAAKGR